MMAQVEKACARANVQVMGGHTEVTRAVNQPKSAASLASGNTER